VIETLLNERMAVRITLECGHTSMLRMRTTPEGYTHDWEVFVRGVDNADIHHYVEKGISIFFIIPTLMSSGIYVSTFSSFFFSIVYITWNILDKLLHTISYVYVTNV